MQFPQDLRDEAFEAAGKLSAALDVQENVIRNRAYKERCSPQELVLKDGSYPFLQVLAAKTELLSTIVRITTS